MVSKIAINAGRYVARKIGNKTLTKAIEKIDKPFAAFNREIFGIKPLNVGEDEILDCYRHYPSDSKRCEDIGRQVREEYLRTGKYTPYQRKK